MRLLSETCEHVGGVLLGGHQLGLQVLTHYRYHCQSCHRHPLTMQRVGQCLVQPLQKCPVNQTYQLWLRQF